MRKKFPILNSKFQILKAFSFIDVIVGVALILIVFLGIFGAFQLALKIISKSKHKIVAVAIANQKIEEIRNLPYESVGVIGGFPEGILEKTTTTLRNNLKYTIETRVDFVVDATDGLALPEDECPNDYKKVEIKVSWPGLFGGGEIKLSTDVSPENLAQECAVKGGILSVLVFDAFGKMVPSPLIEIKDPKTNETLKTATPFEGKYYFSLATSTYKVVVSKKNYNSERTFGIGEVYNNQVIAIPEKPHPIILENQISQISFSIDKLSSFLIKTLSPWGTDYFADTFLNESKISESFNIKVSQGEVNLATTSEGYLSSGYLISTEILPTNLINWDKFSFEDSEPNNTDLKYQIYYATDTNWLLIPDSDLAGNSEGFDVSPLDLSNLATTSYPKLKIRANFSSNTTSSSPTLYNWQISWINSLATPIANVSFLIKGEKIVGKDSKENPIYKYQATSTSDSQGSLKISNLEWDAYTFSCPPASELDLIDTSPSPQPISLSPGTNLEVNLYFKAENSLLVIVQDLETLEPLLAATVRLENKNLDYNNTQYTNEKGQAYFIPLKKAKYNLEVSAPSYSSVSTTVEILGDKIKMIKLKKIE
jgi:hypothetical protein